MARRSSRAAALLLSAVLLMTLLPGGLIRRAAATAADDLEPELLGELSAKYESRGTAGSIGRVSGDPGGASYGLYMFASEYGVPQAFFAWLLASDNAVYQSFGEKLSGAYNIPPKGCGPKFDEAWKACANENVDAFAQAQFEYARERFYRPLVDKLEKEVAGFAVSNYSIALRNVLWSRAIHHGAADAAGLIEGAFENELGGFANQPESELIRAIYAYNARLVDGTKEYPVMTGRDAEKYGVSGKTLWCFRGCSGDIQMGVYIRLWVNEPADAQLMLAQYGYNDAPLGEGLYTVSAAAGSNLGISGTLTLGGTARQFRLTYFASGYYTLASEDGATRLTARSDGTVAMTAPTADNNQMWELGSYNSGFYLKNRATERYLTASSLAAGGTLTTGGSMVQWQFAPGNAGWTLTGASYPTAANGLVEGSSGFYLKGTLRSTHAITSVSAAILNASGGTLYEATAKPNANFYNLNKMDGAMAFSRLAPGSYTFLVTADDVSGDHYELRSPFTVASKNATVTYTLDANGGTCSPATLTLEPGYALSGLPTPTRSGYAFDGWFDENGDAVSNGRVVYSRNTTLTAHWTKTYTYIFYHYDGKTVFSSGALKPGEAIPVSGNPSRAATSTVYYTFSGWSGYTAGMTMGSADVTFTAQYAEHALETLTEITATGRYTVSGGYLRTIPTGTTAAELLSALSPAEYISIRHKSGSIVTGTAGTGMVVVLSPDGTTAIQSLDIVITGDTTGDGIVDITDMMQINAYLLGLRTFSGAAAEAADLSGNGEIDITDFAQILAVTLNRRTVHPN